MKKVIISSLILFASLNNVALADSKNAEQTEIHSEHSSVDHKTDAKTNHISYITLPGKEFFPEGIASDNQGNLYVGSLREGRIVKISPKKNKVMDFVRSGSSELVSVIGMLADDKKGILWVCSSDPKVSKFSGKYPVSLLGFALSDGTQKHKFELPNSGFCNDMILDNEGNLYITDSFNPRIFKLSSDLANFSVFLENNIFSGEGFALNGIAFDEENNFYVVTYNKGNLYRINKDNPNDVKQIVLPRRLYAADGLKFVNKDTLIVVEGDGYSDFGLALGGRGGLTKIELQNGNKAILKNIITGLDAPTTFTIIGSDAWLVESQYDHLFLYKNVAPRDFRVYKVDIKNLVKTKEEIKEEVKIDEEKEKTKSEEIKNSTK